MTVMNESVVERVPPGKALEGAFRQLVTPLYVDFRFIRRRCGARAGMRIARRIFVSNRFYRPCSKGGDVGARGRDARGAGCIGTVAL